ncbi:unnamed protein product [Linum tenue]|uniref:Thylakoid lumenal protein TL20.3, chloroplastic n=1 Tax=Linum tenue TaxID=586396 RepID=A0AAV0JWA3_9ROSI|nr:unnamed protein product [Linum tenue]
MAFTSICPLPMKSTISISHTKFPHHRQRSLPKSPLKFQLSATARRDEVEEEQFHNCSMHNGRPQNWKALVSATLAAAVISFGSSGFQVPNAVAELNKYEANTRGEFGIGSAAQFGSADLRKAVHVNENFRRANFTSADMRESDFSGSTFNGAYMEKAVAYKANFTGMYALHSSPHSASLAEES